MSLSINQNGYSNYNSIESMRKNRNIAFKANPQGYNPIKEDKTNNGKFDLSEAGKNFVKGVISPVTTMIKHPIMTLGMVGATAAACALVPVLGPALAIGFGVAGVCQLGKGCYKTGKLLINKDYDNAEKAFNEIGQGTSNVALSALGIKQSARVAKETKLLDKLNVKSLSQGQKQTIATEVKEGSFTSALKEIESLFTTKTGLKATLNQFKPSNIAQRGKDAFNFIFKRDEVAKVKEKKMKFSETKEGQRRAKMSFEEIAKEINGLYKEAFDEYGIPEGLRPELKIVKENIKNGGGYNSTKHSLVINEDSYRGGVFDLPDVIKHEATHANEAILRQRLPMDEKVKLAQEFFLDKIQNGEKENIITDATFMGLTTGKAPKLNPQMKADFSKLAKDKLYITDKLYSKKELTEMVKPLVDSNSEFVSQCGGKEKAVETMATYARSHNVRYNIAMKASTGFNTSKIDTSLLKPLTGEEKVSAVKTFIDGIDCIESNVAGRGFLGLGGDFNQYQFCTEEVLAQQRGNNFEIAKLNQQLKELRSKPNYDKGEEARILDTIKKSKLTIEYKTKGEEFYKLQTEAKQHPEDKTLAKKVSKMQLELSELLAKIHQISCLIAKNPCSKNAFVNAKEYTQYTAKVPKPTGATVYIPYNVATIPAMLNNEG